MINAFGPLPLHDQLRSMLEEKISSGTWKSGEKIPSEAELSHMFNVSRTTVRQAIGNLVTERKLIRSQGVGTFVATSIRKPNLYLDGFTEDMLNRGLKPGSHLLRYDIIQPLQEIRQNLLLGRDEPVIEIYRIRMADNAPIATEKTYLPYYRFSTLKSSNLEGTSLFEILHKSFNVIPTHSRGSIQALNCPDKEAEILQIPKGSPVLYFSGTNYDQYDQPIQFTCTFFRADRYAFDIEVFKNPAS